MSTRSQIRFVARDDNGNERTAQVYRHSDGYPDSVLSSLERLQQILSATGTHRGPSYAAANYIFFEKLQSMRLHIGDRDRDMPADLSADDLVSLEPIAELNQPLGLLGYGVEEVGPIHGDEEYLYIVDVSHGDNRADWHVTVSEHGGFPTWDDADDTDSFEEMDVQYSGLLHEIVAEHFSDD